MGFLKAPRQLRLVTLGMAAALAGSCSPVSQGPPPAGVWTGKTEGGHRLKVRVEADGAGYRLAGPPDWRIKESFGERMFRKRVAETVADAAGDVLQAFTPPAASSQTARQYPQAQQRWDAPRRRLSYTSGGWNPYGEREFDSAWDFPDTARYQFSFPGGERGSVLLNKSLRIEMRRR